MTPLSCEPPDLRSAIALAFVGRVGCVAYRALVERHGSAAVAFLAEVRQSDRAPALHCADTVLRDVDRIGARVLVLGEPDYPSALLDLRDPPPCLFALGNPDALGEVAIGIVGTRRATRHGERAAHRLAAVLARAGACVVSGMALGIDGAAHRGALESGGNTAAVLGGGVDVIYPPMHRALHRDIATQGVVLSEALPGVPPLPGAFPKRNRLIAALSKAVIVVEAGERSGALLTSRDALELGRVVAAVPGLIDSPQSVGSNQLLRDGAIIIASAEDALVLAGLAVSGLGTVRPEGVAPGTTAPVGALGSHETAVLAAIGAGVANIAGLARHTGLALRDIMAALTALELAGAVQSDHAGEVRVLV